MEHQEGVAPQQNTDTHSSEETTEIFRWLKDNMVTRAEFHEEMEKFATKEDLKKAIAEAKHELKDHTSREFTRINDITFRHNEKTNNFVRTAQKSGTISKNDAERLVAINPFAS